MKQKHAAIYGSNTLIESVKIFVMACESGLKENGFEPITFNWSHPEAQIDKHALVVFSDVDEPISKYENINGKALAKCDIGGSPEQIKIHLTVNDGDEKKIYNKDFNLVSIASGDAVKWVVSAMEGNEQEHTPAPQVTWTESQPATPEDEAVVDNEPDLVDVVSFSQSTALKAIGINTVGQLASADPYKLSQARGVGESRAISMIEKAKEALERT